VEAVVCLPVLGEVDEVAVKGLVVGLCCGVPGKQAGVCPVQLDEDGEGGLTRGCVECADVYVGERSLYI
jgi:hypothetical protein